MPHAALASPTATSPPGAGHAWTLACVGIAFALAAPLLIVGPRPAERRRFAFAALSGAGHLDVFQAVATEKQLEGYGAGAVADGHPYGAHGFVRCAAVGPGDA